MVGVVFLAWPVARAVEGFSYLPDRWLLVNAADVLVSTHPPTGPNALRTPSFAMACVAGHLPGRPPRRRRLALHRDS